MAQAADLMAWKLAIASPISGYGSIALASSPLFRFNSASQL
jgi:hypothetical protein